MGDWPLARSSGQVSIPIPLTWQQLAQALPLCLPFLKLPGTLLTSELGGPDAQPLSLFSGAAPPGLWA